ncbi:MAG: M1 family aminopeptidase [Planctomycetales bacterium]
MIRRGRLTWTMLFPFVASFWMVSFITIGAEDPVPVKLERVRTQDVLHVKAEVALDFKSATISGSVTHSLRPLHDGFRRLEFDCESLTVKKVVVDGREQKFEVQEPKLIIRLDRVYSQKDKLDVKIFYSGSPTRGLYFIKPDEFYPNKPMTAWTQGEPEQTHFWLPCYDYPNDMATSEMIITVPQNLFALSNGRLLSEKTNKKDETKTFHWKMERPHVSYLISLVVGDLVAHHAEVGKLRIDSYVARGRFDKAVMNRAYGRTAEMMRFFNRVIGVPYPWPKYAQVTVPEFRAGGMENVSATTLTEFTLRDKNADLESSADGLIAHELAHQ